MYHARASSRERARAPRRRRPPLTRPTPAPPRSLKNESVAGSHAHLWAGDRTNHVLSDADATLLIHVPFREPVRLSGLIFDAPPELAPTHVRVYVNARSMGFDDVDATEPAAVIALGEGDLGAAIKVRPAKFHAVSDLFIFCERAEGGKVALSKLGFLGAPVGGTDVSKLKDAHGHSHE